MLQCLQVFVDQTLAEAYWQDGRVVMTVSVPPSSSGSAAIVSDTAIVVPSAVAWSVDPIWVEPADVIATPRRDGPRA